MKNDERAAWAVATRLTHLSLQKLKDDGFRYVQVMGFTQDGRLDYMELKYFMLIPVKFLPEDQNKRGIYEPIESKILIEWANSDDDGFEVLVADKK